MSSTKLLSHSSNHHSIGSSSAITPSKILQQYEITKNLIKQNSNETQLQTNSQSQSQTNSNDTAITTSDNDETLPPFSFSKKPCTLSCINETTSNITSKMNKNSNKSSTTTSINNSPRFDHHPYQHHLQDSQHQQHQPTEFRDFDYDEQIRFPRMNSKNCTYTYSTKKSSFSSSEDQMNNANNNNNNFSKRIESFESLNSNKSSNDISKYSTIQEENPSSSNNQHQNHNQNNQNNYKPAIFDLNQPIRRSSEPLKSFKNNDEFRLLSDFQNQTQIYNQNEKENEKENNQTLNITTNSNNIVPTTIEFNKKRPMMTPAVLRPPPIISKKNISNFKKIYTLLNIDNKSLDYKTEPTHLHWKSNNSTNQCFNCSQIFYSKLITIIYDVPKRHHCRFCGMIFCLNCLNLENQVLLDKFANFIIPIKNLSNKLPIQNNKICKKCCLIYENLKIEINNPKNFKNHLNLNSISQWFLLIENPNLLHSFSQAYNDSKILRFKQFCLGDEDDEGDDTDEDEIENGNGRKDSFNGGRKSSFVVNDLSNDWNWSSF
ncbi:uncharacterized protein KGF55_000381 [Candida pseudojiufengensis]|uniref:uncharacterized protein n=1 Tax=Candida pseudojiufengensis TaxID=497109 RepID=UPI00222575F6|nr:uncharacterized protein KGF55_000381 [Candida pseudojiufengensis]KAI5966972.1 hypothetical protein KGF55_000381 [Candida pseudojiufengensis]